MAFSTAVMVVVAAEAVLLVELAPEPLESQSTPLPFPSVVDVAGVGVVVAAALVRPEVLQQMASPYA